MSRPRWNISACMPWIGLGLVLAMFVLALFRMPGSGKTDGDGRVVVRIAHWQLEAGIREGIDAAARAYEALHPDVRIEQLLVPERVYPTWLTTRLIGGDAPDIVELPPNYDAARVAAHFMPIGEAADRPNPHNAGTAMEGVAWRNTFLDGLASAYHEELADYYGAGPFTGSRCLYFNRRLLRELTGTEEPPADYEGFERVMARLAERNRARGESISGYATHKASALALFNDLFASHLQRLGTELAPETGLPVTREELYRARLLGRWDFTHAHAGAALDNIRDLSRSFPPGFAQLGREDALLAFVQGRALFYFSGTWDATNLAAQADFPVGVTRALLPGPDHPRFGGGVIGPLASDDRSGSPAFSVSRDGTDPERALDFLRFLTSVPGNTLFSQASGWLPSVVDVPGPEELVALLDTRDGHPRGPSPLGGADTNMAFARSLSRLTSPGGGPEAFLREFAPASEAAMRADLQRSVKSTQEGLRRDDIAIIALRVIAGGEPSPQAVRRAETQNEREAWAAYLTEGLAGSDE